MDIFNVGALSFSDLPIYHARVVPSPTTIKVTCVARMWLKGIRKHWQDLNFAMFNGTTMAVTNRRRKLIHKNQTLTKLVQPTLSSQL